MNRRGSMDMFANLQAFVAVGKARSFSRAAQQLGVSKSIVSERVKQLEQFIGQRLLFRSTRLVQLSPVGHDVLQQCEDLVERTDRLIERMTGGGYSAQPSASQTRSAERLESVHPTHQPKAST
jgi:DNA-binding transcriptional LysR family regulator